MEIRERQTIAQLRELQRLMFSCVSLPLGKGRVTARSFTDGRSMEELTATFIKPNSRLTSLERIGIYNRQYWFRLLDCLWDDYPGLRSLLGHRRFERLRIAYLTAYPSRSFTLRDLGSRLVEFLEQHPEMTSPLEKVCLDMARFEWARIVGFDGLACPSLAIDDLLGQDPAGIRLAIQPHITLLQMDHAIDDFVIAMKKRESAMRSEASNAIETDRPEKAARRMRPPKPERVFVAVHRHDNALYYRRLQPTEYHLLCALRDGQTLVEACDSALAATLPASDGDPVNPEQLTTEIKHWFTTWAQLGWFCKRARVRIASPKRKEMRRS